MKPSNVTCPKCGGNMISRVNRQSGRRFWGCANYPECKGTRDTDGNSKEDRDKDYDNDVEEDQTDTGWKRRYE